MAVPTVYLREWLRDRVQAARDGHQFRPLDFVLAARLVDEMDQMEHEMILVRAENVRLRNHIATLDNPPQIDGEAWGGGNVEDVQEEDDAEDLNPGSDLEPEVVPRLL